jgi:phytanoyl-CoA hydroxylase
METDLRRAKGGEVSQAARDDAATHYERDGYVIVRQVIDESLVEQARRHIDWLRQRYPDTRPEQLDHEIVGEGDPFWIRLVSDDRLLDLAQQFIGPNIALFASHYIAKPPFEGQPVLWHQDGSYWPLNPMVVVTLWLALDESVPENGCLRIIPRTHLQQLVDIRERPDVENVLGSEMNVDPDSIRESEAVDVVLSPGDVSIHHPNVVHGSEPNDSPRWRRGLTIRYIPTSTRIVTDSPWPSAFLLRGEAAPGVNHYQPRPRYVEGVHMPFEGCEAWR